VVEKETFKIATKKQLPPNKRKKTPRIIRSIKAKRYLRTGAKTKGEEQTKTRRKICCWSLNRQGYDRPWSIPRGAYNRLKNQVKKGQSGKTGMKMVRAHKQVSLGTSHRASDQKSRSAGSTVNLRGPPRGL